MARDVDTLIEARGTLTARTALHIGGVETAPGLDMPLQLDGRGRPFIPGTSLAGVMRHWCARNLNDVAQAAAGALFGGDTRSIHRDRGTEDRTPASTLIIHDAPLTGSAPVAELRHHNAVDRATGAVAKGIFFDREVLPQGAEFAFSLTAQLAGEHTETQTPVVLLLLDALEQGRIRVGGGTSRGLGRVELVLDELRERNLSDPAVARSTAVALARGDRHGGSAIDLLGGKGADRQKTTGHAAANLVRARNDLEISIAWEPVTPVMVHSAETSECFDHLPLTTMVGDHLHLVLPGSSVKGALRDVAERIVRTCIGMDGPEPAQRASDMLDQWAVPLVEDLFGSPRAKDDSCTQAGLLGVDDTVADEPQIKPSNWARILAEPKPGDDPSKVRKLLKKCELGDWEWRHHVAIDRWLGGAAEGLLYADLEPWGVRWPELRISVRDGHLEPFEEYQESLVLLALVFGELAAGRIRVGHGGSRGLGEIRVTGIRVDEQPVDWEWTGADIGPGAVRGFVDSFLIAALGERDAAQAISAWQAWTARPTEALSVSTAGGDR